MQLDHHHPPPPPPATLKAVAAAAAAAATTPAHSSTTTISAATNSMHESLHQGLADSHANKRKRDNHHASDAVSQLTPSAQRDLLALLESRDGASAFLHHIIADSNEHSHKKPKVDDGGNDRPKPAGPSISSKLQDASYTHFSQLSVDAARVKDALSSSIRSKTQDDPLLAGRLSIDDMKQLNRVKAVNDLIQTLVEQETQYAHSRSEAPGLTNGHVSQDRPEKDNGAGTVLTLFGGNPPTHRHLFSSAQIPMGGASGSTIKSDVLADELNLPSGISATKLLPGPIEEVKKRTFEEAFPAPFKLAELPLPKASKRAPARDNSLTWEFKDPIQRNKKGGYTVQNLTVGTWVGYGSADGSATLSSPREKRRQRDRALSSSDGARPPPSPAETEDALAKEVDALFLRAYSSFAPVRDNSASIIPEETKNMVWWQKIGDKRFSDAFALDPALADSSGPADIEDERVTLQKPIPDAGEFEKMVDELESYREPAYAPVAQSKTDIDEVLGEISSLLETLSSYQQIRNTTLPISTTVARPPVSPASALAVSSSRPDEPSAAEVEVYQKIRREIAYLILQLPPYAVAKLDGDQLAELGVSRLILLNLKDVKGTMEEDRVARQAKLSAMTTASTIANLTNRPTSSSAGQHYNATARQTPAIGQAANTRYGQQYAPRTPAPPTQYQRSTSNQGSYGTPSATGSMASWRNTPARPTPQMPYTQPNGHQYYQQRPAQQTPTSYSTYKSTFPPQVTPQAVGAVPRPYASPMPPLQQQYQPPRPSNMAAANAIGYLNRSASPAKPPTAAGAGTSYVPPQQQQPVQTASMQARPQYPPPQQQQQQQQQQQTLSRSATPNNGAFPASGAPHSQSHTPVQHGFQRPPQVSLASRPPSGTPQPALAPVPPLPITAVPSAVATSASGVQHGLTTGQAQPRGQQPPLQGQSQSQQQGLGQPQQSQAQQNQNPQTQGQGPQQNQVNGHLSSG